MASSQPQMEAYGDYRSQASLGDNNEIYHNLIINLRDKLKELGVISRAEYVGSAYKGTMMASSDMDNLFVKRDGTITVANYPQKQEYAFLSRAGQQLHPRGTLDMFKGKIQQVLNGLGLANKVVLADHGPAIELRYHSDGMRPGTQPQFTADLVFCYEVNTGQSVYRMYTAKQPFTSSHVEQMLWKQSTALEEKQMMSTIDKDHTCRRWAIRIMKAIKDQEASLRVLTSYVFEQVLFGVYGQMPTEFWKEANMKEIVRLLLQKTADGVEAGIVRNHFNPVENVLRPMDDITRGNIVNRLRRLARDPVLDTVLAKV